MRTVKKDPETGLPEKYLSGSKNRSKRAEVINKGKKAYEEGKRLPDEYFAERMMYGEGGEFPDLTGDGKVTQADILKGRKVFKKGGKVTKKKEKKVSSKPLSESTKKTLRNKAKSSGKSYSTLVKVYRRGQGAWLSSGSRTGASMAAWAMGRVNSFIKGSKKHDTDL